MSKRIDITGKIFGDTWVLEFSEKRNTHAIWKCLCMICNEVYYPTYSNLKSGNTHACMHCSRKTTNYQEEYEIRQKYANKDSVAQIARDFNVSRGVVYRILSDV